MTHPVQAAREARGWSQVELARRAGVTRQLVGTVEAGRHAPRVDAALALAAALGAGVEQLFGGHQPDVPVPFAGTQPPGSPVVAARVGDRLVHAPAQAPTSAAGAQPWWAVADALTTDDGLAWFPGARDDGLLVAGCDPALGLLATLVSRRCGRTVHPVHASSAAAVQALHAGRAHAALVHGPGAAEPGPGMVRVQLASWRVGLAAPADRAVGPDDVGARSLRVVQREDGAGSQAAFLRAMAAGGSTAPPGPVVGSHLEAALRVLHGADAAVTTEPTALAAGLSFAPLEEHAVELWVADEHRDHPAAAALLDLLAETGLARRLAALPGYDTSGTGRRAS